MNKMMNLVPVSLLMLFLMGFSNMLYAQTDYIINNDNTKVMGEVKSHSVDKVKFIPVGVKKAQKFNAQQIKEAYQAGHGVFRSVAVSDGKKPCFLQVLEDGEIKLYEYNKGTTMYNAPVYGGGMAGGGMGFGTVYNNTKKRWYAQKDGSAIVEVKSNGIWGSRKDRKDNFLNMIKDNVHVKERYEKADKFSFDFVQSLIVEYNTLKAKP